MVKADTCNYNGRKISVKEALTIKQQDNTAVFTCIKCGKRVKPHRAGSNCAAHFEHYKRNENCPWSHHLR